MPLRLLPWSPEYGTAMQFDADADGGDSDSAGGSVTVEGVERPDWVAIAAPRETPAALQIIDGVRRVEAHAMEDRPAGSPLVGLFGSLAVGVVRCPGEAVAEIPRDLIEVRRRYLQAGGEPADRVAGSAPYPLTFRARLESGTTANALVEALNREMLDAEALLADTLSRDDSMLTLVDGPLRHLRSPGHRVVGYVKRIVRWYVDEAHRRLLPELPLAHRTPLFTITNQRGVDRYSWFLRIADLGPHYHPLGGITRLEAQGTLPLPQAVALADETAAALPPLASSLARDPRAPQNLTPVGALEATLTHRLGDREWVRRLIASALSAPSQATAEAVA